LKILNINTSLGLGGTERAAVNYAVGYRRLGHDSKFLVIYGGEERKQKLIQNGVPVYKYIDNEKILEMLSGWHPQVIHFHRSNDIDPHIKSIINYFRQKSKILVVETNVFSRYLYEKWYRENVDVSLQLSQWCLWKYKKWRGRYKRPFAAYGPYAVDGKNFFKEENSAVEDFKKKNNIEENAFVIGRIGQPLDSKWHPHIVSFFERACRKYHNLILFLVGPSPSVKKAINDLDKQIKEKIRLIDRIEGDKNLRLYYSSLDIFLHHSKIGESFGYVLTEAMMCDVPIITRSTSLKDNSQVEVVGNGLGGKVVDNSESLWNAFIFFYTQPAVGRKMRTGLKSWVLDRFEASKLCRDFVIGFENFNEREEKCVEMSPWMLLSQQGLNLNLWARMLVVVYHQPWIYKIYQILKRRIR